MQDGLVTGAYLPESSTINALRYVSIGLWLRKHDGRSEEWAEERFQTLQEKEPRESSLSFYEPQPSFSPGRISPLPIVTQRHPKDFISSIS